MRLYFFLLLSSWWLWAFPGKAGEEEEEIWSWSSYSNCPVLWVSACLWDKFREWLLPHKSLLHWKLLQVLLIFFSLGKHLMLLFCVGYQIASHTSTSCCSIQTSQGFVGGSRLYGVLLLKSKQTKTQKKKTQTKRANNNKTTPKQNTQRHTKKNPTTLHVLLYSLCSNISNVFIIP